MNLHKSKTVQKNYGGPTFDLMEEDQENLKLSPPHTLSYDILESNIELTPNNNKGK